MRTHGDIDRFATLLGKAGLELGAEEMADALWLARHINPRVREQEEEEDIEEEAVEPTIREEYLDNEREDNEDETQLTLSLPQKQDRAEGGAVKPDGIPIKAPAAPALRIRLELARALRPLRRRVPSPVRMEFDQAATIERIADHGIWSPVLSPAPERWLDVALVIEESKSAPLWKETLAEFQTLLKRQGAFRTVSSWRLRSGEAGELTLLSGKSSRARSARELLDPAGRRLILIVSDCTSAAWQRGTIYPWLEIWGEQAPTTVIQLLPERLWAQTGLAHGVPVWLSSLEPGVPSARMLATPQTPLWNLFESAQKQVTVPVVSLEAEPLKHWASVITGVGESRMVGFRFEKRELASSEVEGAEQTELSAEERVRLFRATASITAQKLAGLMSAAPVSPLIVNLIRQTMLPKAEPVHVAEVYMGGLMKLQTEEEYDFLPEIRDMLLDTISIKVTEQVLNAVSGYVSERLNLNIHSFEALLSFDFEDNAKAEEMVMPFAKLTIQILQRMGQEHKAIAERVQTHPKRALPTNVKDMDDRIPPLQQLASKGKKNDSKQESEDIFSIIDWLESHNFTVDGCKEPKPTDVLFDRAAILLGEQYTVLQPFHQRIKRSIDKGEEFAFWLRKKSKDDINHIASFCELLNNQSFLPCRYFPSQKKIVAKPPTHPDVINFLTGDWFESFVHQQVCDFLSKNGIDYTSLKQITGTLADGRDFELNLLFWINNQPLWIECKSGQDYNDYLTKYSQFRKYMKLPKERALLVIADLNRERAADYTSLWEITVASMDGLIEVISHSLGLESPQEHRHEDVEDIGNIQAAEQVETSEVSAIGKSGLLLFLNKRSLNP